MKELQALEKPLLEILGKLHDRVRGTSTFNMVQEFYTKDQRVALYAQYKQLREAQNTAVANVIAEHTKLAEWDKDIDGYESRVRKYGQEKAKDQLREAMKASAIVEVANNKYRAFRKEHPLIERMLEEKKALGTGPYD